MGSSSVQGRLWGAAARDWAVLFEPTGEPLWDAMLASAEVGHGTRFLDLGCGGGGASILAARRGAQVAGLDAAQALVDIARERIPEGDFRVGDLEDLPYNDSTFDVTFASLSLMFAIDTIAALAEMERVTVQGGRVTGGIWGKPEDCEYRHVLQAVAALRLSPAPAKGPFALSEPELLEGMMMRVGLDVVDRGEVDAPFQFADSEMLWQVVRSAGPVQGMIEIVGEPPVRAAVVQAAEPFQSSNGDILLHNRFRYVTALASSRHKQPPKSGK